MKEKEMEMIGDLIDQVIRNVGNEKTYRDVKESVRHLCEKFPLYSELLSETVQHVTAD
jgi:glycine/serine hydroxymethyltransferase